MPDETTQTAEPEVGEGQGQERGQEEQDFESDDEEEEMDEEEMDEEDEEEQLRVMAETAWAEVEHEFSMLSSDVAIELGGSKMSGADGTMVTLAAVVDILGVLEGVIDTGLIMSLVGWILYILTPFSFVLKISKVKQMVMKMSPERASRRMGKLVGCLWSRFIGYCMWRMLELIPVGVLFPSWTKTSWSERKSKQRKLEQLKALQKDLDDFSVKLKDAASVKQDDPSARIQSAYTFREEVKALDERYMSIC